MPGINVPFRREFSIRVGTLPERCMKLTVIMLKLREIEDGKLSIALISISYGCRRPVFVIG